MEFTKLANDVINILESPPITEQKQITLAPLREDGERIEETFTRFEFRRKALPTRFVYFADNPTEELGNALIDGSWRHAAVISSALGCYVLIHHNISMPWISLSPKPNEQ